MQKVAGKKYITIREPVVVLPLREWKRIEEELEDREELDRFNSAFNESRGKKMVGLEALGKKYKLR